MTTTHRITTTAAIIVSLASAGAPTATASPHPGGTTPNTTAAAVYSRQDKSLIPADSASTSAGDSANVNAVPAVVRLETPPSGFDWGDAGIGAAGGVALAMLGLGGALVVSQRRPSRNSRTTPLS
jgi:hypothetical protein